MTDTTMWRPLDAAALDGRSREGCDRASILRLGQLFVLAIGIVLVVVAGVTVYEMITGLLADVTAAGEPVPPAGP